MDKLSGRLTARLADQEEKYDNNLIDEINRCVKPPRDIKPDDVQIRAMYIVSDQINSQGGRFDEEELDLLVKLIIDSPVMVGHRRDSLPLARNFKAEKVEIDNRIWIKSYFYWMKESEAAEDLKNNIDGGIYKECSISFLFKFPECSICGQDIRGCRHIPFQEYETDAGQSEIACFKYRGIEKVLETSLVFRGSIPETRITDKLTPANDDQSQGEVIAETLFVKPSDPVKNLDGDTGFSRAFMKFDRSNRFSPGTNADLSIYPYQPGLNIRISKSSAGIQLESTRLLPEKIRKHLNKVIGECDHDSFEIDAILYATKGKRRLDGFGLARILESVSNIHRLRLRLCDLLMLNGEALHSLPFAERREKLSKEFMGKTGRSMEVLHIRKVSTHEWEQLRDSDETARYNFGLETIDESGEGRLTRNILTDRILIPARVEQVAVKNGNHLNCKLRLINENREVISTICAKQPGLEKEAIVLLSGDCRTGAGRHSKATIIDILPGNESCSIKAVSSGPGNDEKRLHVTESKNGLAMYLKLDSQWRRLNIHHFARHLFREGRRFIADLEDRIDISDLEMATNNLPLESISRHGKLIVIRLERDSEIFGNNHMIWLRPVLIDGRERLLFYSGSAVNLPAGL